MLDWLSVRLEEANKGRTYQGNCLFLHRSPLSIDMHAEIRGGQSDLGRRMLSELRSRVTNLSLINCWADPIRQIERLGERSYLADGIEKLVLEELRDFDQGLIDKKRAQSEAWQARGEFDGEVPTTSTKQATAHLVTLLGIEFDPVFSLEALTGGRSNKPD